MKNQIQEFIKTKFKNVIKKPFKTQQKTMYYKKKAQPIKTGNREIQRVVSSRMSRASRADSPKGSKRKRKIQIQIKRKPTHVSKKVKGRKS